MSKIIPVSNLLDFYKKGLFPMADNADSEIINLYQPKKRFIIPIITFMFLKNYLNYLKEILILLKLIIILKALFSNAS